MNDLAGRIVENLRQVHERIEAAAIRSGRKGNQVALVAVTKYVAEPEIRALLDAGCTRLGESRPQQLWERGPQFADFPIHWHFIGHLQRNKIRRTLPLTALIHSVDSFRLAEALDQTAAELSLRVPVLLEVHTSGDETKGGFEPDELEPLFERFAALRHVEIRGLMCMASLYGGQDTARRNFASLRNLRDRLRAICPDSIALDELSMGMSGDYEVAIEEGATIVRVGSALFEGLEG